MNVHDVMTPREDLVTVELPGSRDDALVHLKQGTFSSVPVIKHTDDGEEYRGLVSREDLINNPDEDQLALLLRSVPTVTSDTSITDAAAVMVAEEARRLPVVDEHLSGIVTVTDIIRAIAEGAVDGGTAVREIATPSVLSTYHETPLVVATRQLQLANRPYAIVLDDDGEMAGMITEIDLIEVARVVDGEEQTGASVAGQDSEWMWEGIKATSTRLLPTRNVELPDAPVAEYMTEDVHAVAGSRTVKDAARTMLTHRLKQLPQVSGDEVVAIVRDMDLLRAIQADD